MTLEAPGLAILRAQLEASCAVDRADALVKRYEDAHARVMASLEDAMADAGGRSRKATPGSPR